jgi:hypothetical protein
MRLGEEVEADLDGAQELVPCEKKYQLRNAPAI